MSVPEDGHSANTEWIHPRGPCGIEGFTECSWQIYPTFNKGPRVLM